MNNYFSHDSNARNSSKMLQVRMKVGAIGYAIYFMLLERLRDEDDYTSVKDYNAIAFDLRVDASQIKAVVEDFGLFAFTDDGKYFYSEGFNKRMALKDAKSRRRSEAGKKGANSRWNGNSKANPSTGEEESKPKPSQKNSNAMAMPSDSDGKESKVKESKVKDKKTIRPNSDKPKYGPDDQPYQIAQHLLKAIRDNDPDFSPKGDERKLQTWANDIRLAHTQDGHAYDKLDGMVDWCQHDDFWKSNILSGAKLRKQFDQMKMQAASRGRGGSKPTRAKETLPDWAQKTPDKLADKTKGLSPDKQAELDARIKKFKAKRAPEEAQA
ncbi:Lin1244/Lin1753 domain-containing protein [Levilactobacillus tangyuanensis]|uniref:Lin1244/Lin1753 domain-containing protein n=1 Tax=Levilactobacillus tangyuanensis TaxID=2486021 RepID=A0ABW1TQR3_9LACO|nr:Lin1244/Lin1753 domain-containing protein [Levilactobacillus tangyuanensis]